MLHQKKMSEKKKKREHFHTLVLPSIVGEGEGIAMYNSLLTLMGAMCCNLKFMKGEE